MENSNQPVNPYPTITLDQLLNEPCKPTEWLIDRLLPQGGIGIIAGQPGIGKSWLLLDLAMACSRGKPWLGVFPTKRCSVLYIDEESWRGFLKERSERLAGDVKTSGNEQIHFSIGSCISLNDPSSIARLRQTVAACKPSLVVIDPLIRVHRADENSAREMALVFNEIKNLAREFHCGFMIADHHGKGSGPDGRGIVTPRGSSDKVAFVDCLLSVREAGESLIIDHVKSRNSERSKPIRAPRPDQHRLTAEFTGELTENSIVPRSSEKEAEMLLLQALQGREQVTRQELVEHFEKNGHGEKLLDRIAQKLVSADKLGRKTEKRGPGSGGLSAVFWLKHNETSY